MFEESLADLTTDHFRLGVNLKFLSDATRNLKMLFHVNIVCG